MDYSNEIKFSNSLVKNGEAYIRYSGNLYQQNSGFVHIVYGFGDNWEHTTEKEMEMNSYGFVAKIKLLDYDKFNFCFKNQYNEWDNNNGLNYSSPIIEETDDEYNFIINEGLLDELIDNASKNYNTNKLVENDENAKVDDKNNTDNSEDSANVNKVIDIMENVQVINIEVSPIEVQSANLETLSHEEIQDIVSQDDIMVDDTVDSVSQDDITGEEHLNSNTEKSEEFDMNSLIDEILSPIVTSEDFIEENLDDYKKTSNSEFVDLLDDNAHKEEDKRIDDVITDYLNDLYKNIDSNSDNSNINNNTPKIENNYSELDKTISKFKQIQALQDLECFFNNNFDSILNLSNTPSSEDTSNLSPINNVSNNYIDNIIDNKIDADINKISNTIENIYQNQSNVYDNSINDNNIYDTINKSNDDEEQSLIEDAINIKPYETIENTAEKNPNPETHNIDVQNSNGNDETENEETALIVSPRHLSPLYVAKKKLKISFLKIFRFIPRLFNKKINEQ